MAKRSSEQGVPAAKRQNNESDVSGLTMQLLLTFPDSGYPDVVFIATADSLAKDALEAAAGEWLVDPVFLEVSYLSDVLPPSSTLLSNGVAADSQLTVSLLRWIGKELLTDASTREKVGELIEKGSFGSDQILHLDTPTFTGDTGCLDFKTEWIPEGVLNICFANTNSAITSIAPEFLKRSNITNVDLLGLQNITSVGYQFLRGCTSLIAVDLANFNNVTSIDYGFLWECTSLTAVDLSSLNKITLIRHSFLASCSSLKSVDLSNCSNVTSLGFCFLASCCSLAALDISGLSKVTFIDCWFLDRCSSLKKKNVKIANPSRKSVIKKWIENSLS